MKLFCEFVHAHVCVCDYFDAQHIKMNVRFRVRVQRS